MVLKATNPQMLFHFIIKINASASGVYTSNIPHIFVASLLVKDSKVVVTLVDYAVQMFSFL